MEGLGFWLADWSFRALGFPVGKTLGFRAFGFQGFSGLGGKYWGVCLDILAYPLLYLRGLLY